MTLSKPENTKDKVLRCSFCGREKPAQVEQLIANSRGDVHICRSCVEVCNEVLAAADGKRAGSDDD